MTVSDINQRYPLRVISFFFLLVVFAGAPVQAKRSPELIYAFKNFEDLESVEMLLVGEIRSKTKVPEPYGKTTPYSRYDIRKDQVTVKVAHSHGLRVGQRLYVIDKRPFHRENRNGLIVGEITVKSLSHSPYYGWILTGEGNLLRVREGNFVARTLDTEQLERAFVFYKQGDLHRNRGDIEKAISHYSEALVADSSLPEAHAALGELYLEMTTQTKKSEPIRARSEFELAWRHRENFRYDADRSDFFLSYLSALAYTYDLIRNSSPRSERVVHLQDRMFAVLEAARKDYGYSGTGYDLASMQALYYRIHYYWPGDNAKQRNLLDDSIRQYEKILLRMYEKPASEIQFHKMAALYYSMYLQGGIHMNAEEKKKLVITLYQSRIPSLHRASRMQEAATDPQDMVIDLLRYHIEHYFRYAASRQGHQLDSTMRWLRDRVSTDI